MSVIGLILGVTGLVSINKLTRMSNDLEKLQIESNGAAQALSAHHIWRHELT